MGAHPGHLRPSPAAHVEVWREQSLTVLTSGEVGIRREWSLAGWQRWLWRRDLGGEKRCQEMADRAGHLAGDGVRVPQPKGRCSSPQPSPALTCCIGQVVLCRQQRVPEVVVVVMRREQALGGRRAGPVAAPLPRARSPDAAAAPAAPHHPTAATVPLLRRLLAYLERGKQTHAEGHDQLPQGTYRDIPSAFAQKAPMMLMGSGGMAKSLWRTQGLFEDNSFLTVSKLCLPAQAQEEPWDRESPHIPPASSRAEDKCHLVAAGPGEAPVLGHRFGWSIPKDL